MPPTPESISIGTAAEDPSYGSLPVDPAPAPAGAKCPTVARNEIAFVVIDTLLHERSVAARSAELAAAGLRGHTILRDSCLNRGRGDAYVITTGVRYPNLPRAREGARAYRDLLREVGLTGGGVQIARIPRGD